MQRRFHILDRFQIHGQKLITECSGVYLLSSSAISQAFSHQFSARKHWFEHKTFHGILGDTVALGRVFAGTQLFPISVISPVLHAHSLISDGI